MDTQTARRVDAEIAKLMTEAEKLGAETRKLHSESLKMTRETFWYPVAVAAGLMGAGAALFGALSKVFG